MSLPPGLDLSAYRIVQEGLTNTLKHSGASQAEVQVRYGPRELEVEVRDDGTGGAAPGDDDSVMGLGHGLVGIRERSRSTAGRCQREPHGPVATCCAPASPRRSGHMTIRVLVVDDQSMVRAGFRLLLADEPDIEVVADASNGLEAIAQAARFHPNVILMDIRMPELDGLEATRRILAADPAARVLILTTFDLDDYVYEALRAGASGFVLKDDPPEQLIAAVHTIAAGDALLSPAVTKRVIQHFTSEPTCASSRGREPDDAGARRLPAHHARPVQRRDRTRAVHQRDHGQDPRDPTAPEARRARPRPGDRPRLPVRALRRVRPGLTPAQARRPPKVGREDRRLVGPARDLATTRRVSRS